MYVKHSNYTFITALLLENKEVRFVVQDLEEKVINLTQDLHVVINFLMKYLDAFYKMLLFRISR